MTLTVKSITFLAGSSESVSVKNCWKSSADGRSGANVIETLGSLPEMALKEKGMAEKGKRLDKNGKKDW
jgi:hypothetical protein